MIKTLKIIGIIALGAIIGSSVYVYNTMDRQQAEQITLGGPTVQNFNNIQPFTDNTYDNGSATNAWRRLYTYGITLSTTTGGCLDSNGGIVYTTGTHCGTGSGGGGAPAFTPTSYGASTTTTLGFLQGFFSTASSTISGPFRLPALSNGELAVFGGLVSSGATTTAGTGLTYSGNAFNVNTTQNITNLSNLSSNGLVKTSGGTGSLSIATNGTDYTLITAKTCSAGDFVSSVTAAGVFTCTTPAGTTYTGTFPIQVSGTVISSLFSTTTNWGYSTLGLITVGSNGVPYVTASSSLALPNSALQNSTISGVALGGTLANHSHDSSLTGTTYNGSAAVSDWGLALNHTNTWSVLQNFNYASITSYISAVVASSTNFTGGGLTTCTGSNALQYTAAGFFSCASTSGGGTVTSVVAGAGFQNRGLNITNSGTLVVGIATSTNPTIGQVAYWTGVGDASNPATVGSVATSSIANGTNITVTNGATAYVLGAQPTINLSGVVAYANGGTGSTTAPQGQLIYGGATSYQSVATTTFTPNSDFTTTGTIGALVGGSNSTLALNATIGSTHTWTGLQTFTNSTTSLGSFTYASSTKYFGANLTTCNSASNALTWNAGIFGCNTISSSGSGSGNVATSSHEVQNQIPYFTSNSGTPALISGSADFQWDNTNKILSIATTTDQFAQIDTGGELDINIGGDGEPFQVLTHNGTSNGSSGGLIGLFAGNGKTTGNGGDISVSAGFGDSSSGTGRGGTITYSGGNGGASSGAGGDVTFGAGNAIGGSSDGGSLYFLGGTTVGGSGGKLNFKSGGGGVYAVLDTLGLSSSDKTFTFPNTSGTFCLTTTCTGSPGGSATNLQYNTGSGFGGISNSAYTSSINTTGFGTTTPQWLLQLSSSTAPQLALGDGTNPQWTFRNAGGNLYIGTSSPTSFATSTVPLFSLIKDPASSIGGSVLIGTTTLQDYNTVSAALSIQGGIDTGLSDVLHLFDDNGNEMWAFDRFGDITANSDNPNITQYTIRTTQPNANNTSASGIEFLGGTGSGSGNGGEIEFDSGQGGGSGNGGDFTFTSGLGGNGGSPKNGGSFNLIAAEGRNGGNGGNFTLSARAVTTDSGVTAGTAGSVSITAGSITDSANVTGTAGSVSITAGSGAATNKVGGANITFTGGNGGTSGNTAGGSIILKPGLRHSSGTLGVVKITDPVSTINGILDMSSLSSSDKTFTFPNTTGTLCLTSTCLSTYDAFTHPFTSYSATTSVMMIGTSTPDYSQLTLGTSTVPQLTLTDDNNTNTWTLRDTGSTFYLATASPTTYATSTSPAFSITPNGTTTIQALNILGGASGTSTSAVGWSITNGCYAIAGTCISFSNLTGVVPVSSGGTNNSSLTADQVLYVDHAGTKVISTASSTETCTSPITCTSFDVLKNGGAITLGTVTVAKGGTNQTSYPINSIITSDSAGTSLIATTSQLTVGNLIATTTANSYFLGSVEIGTTTNSTVPGRLVIASTTTSQITLQGAAGDKPFSFRSIGNEFYIATSSATSQATSTVLDMKIDTNGHVFFPSTTLQSAAATDPWCYDANSQLIRVSNTCTVSALKFKKDITPLKQGLTEVLKMQPVNYYNKDSASDLPDAQRQQIGFIADWSDSVVPLLVVHDSNGDIHGFNYEQYTAVLTKAIQELNAKVDNISGVTKKSVQDNWQWFAIGWLGLWNVYLTFRKRK